MTDERAEYRTNQDRLEELVTGATEAEAEPNRHRMEEAVLATLAKVGPGDPFQYAVWKDYARGALVFSRSDLAAIAKALVSCVCDQGIPADAVLIRDSLKEAGATVQDAALSGILDGSKVVDVAVAGEYIKKLVALDQYRRAEEAGLEYLAAVAKAKDKGEDTEAAFAELSRGVFDLARGKKLVKEHRTEAEAAPVFLDALADRRADDRKWSGLDCGFDHLNEVLNGLGEGVFILAGAPSTGKTTLIKQIADHVAATEGVPVLFWSFEQSAEELRIKSLARLASIDSRAIWKGRTDPDTWAKVTKAGEEYFRGPGPSLTIIEAGRTDTVEAIRAAAVMAKHRAGDKPVLLVIDYLQIIPAGPEAPDAIRERVDWNLSELRRLSRDLKSPVLVVSSENREAYKGNNKPTLAVLKESGGIEYSADAVLCLWRDNKESARLSGNFGQKTVQTNVFVLKNRNGELAKAKLNFTPAWALFTQEGKKEDLSWSAALGE